ncbi:multiple organellar RNA editing factor 8, chloroplastic/mitochondrial-like [Humulus lupulus]|uniref:multiple organellar RNA editing factor 8, chloroplastic/mitochondrial-like n=1 Tax=Humulus lupulus TaxID=3486 RepID=UPI002B414CC3|nr:multiple organellar RNA editing factor 8, chloroplastic/mitochondrial-like [Humulus lupulus]
MATNFLSRSLPRTLTIASLVCRPFSITSASVSIVQSRSSLSFLHRLRPLVGAFAIRGSVSPPPVLRCFSTNVTSSSLNDPNPNWSNRPPKETILLDGCDFEHWLVVMEPPEGDLSRDEIIDSYIKTLAMVVGSEQEARMKIYSVSTRCYFAFGALVSEELSYKIKELPKVRWVLPDSYLDVRNKDYGGEPFINGEAVPYDPKYHEEWIRNNARANERNRRNDRPRNFDRSRNFERRRENTQNRDFQRGAPPMPNQMMQNAGPNSHRTTPSSNMGPPPPNMGPPPPNMGGMPQNNMAGSPRNNMNPPYNYGGMPPRNSWNGTPPNNYGGAPPSHNMESGPPSMGGIQGNGGGSGNVPTGDYQNSYTPGRDVGNVPGRNNNSS